MADKEQIRTIVGIIGNVISFLLFLSPVPTIVKIWKEKSVQEYKSDPYVATVLNCAIWVLYGLPFVHPDSLLVITINGTGLAIETSYVMIFLVYSEWPKRRKIIIYLVIEAIFLITIIFITMLCLHGTTNRSMLVGVVAVVLNIIMYAAPLTVMKQVITTKSVKYMPLTLSLANFFNGCIWFAYALIKFDIYILIPNGLGAISGFVQLCLYAKFYGTTNWNEEDKPQVELSETNHIH